MDLFSLAVSGFKAVQTVHTCYAKAKELHTLATKEIAVSVEKLAAALQCLQAPLRLAQVGPKVWYRFPLLLIPVAAYEDAYQ